MSTAFDLRGLATPHTVAEPEPAARPARRAEARRMVPADTVADRRAAGTAKIAGLTRPLFVPLRYGAFKPGRAGFFACAILALSVLGLVYITQISHVARYGYRLSSLQQQQAKLDRENALLQNQVATERTLAQASKLAGSEYKMQPILDGAKSGVTASAAPGTTATKVASSASRNAPQIRFITAQRPRTTPVESVAPSKPLSLLDRLWNRLVGVGAARAAE